MKKYRNRIADGLLERKLLGKGAVLIEGPKWCGKTTTATKHASSVLRVDDPKLKEQNLLLARIDPQKLLKGKAPRLLDEWQLAPTLWDAVRYEVDQRGKTGQFILTGSAVPADTSLISHSGTGRFSWMTMRPMSLFESGESTGEVSLGSLFAGNPEVDGENHLELGDISFILCRGGWPAALDLPDDAALYQAVDYYDGVVNSDINRADGIEKNPERVKMLMRSYARNMGSQASNLTIARDISCDDETVKIYINALKRIFVVEEMAAWNPNLRSKTAVRTSATRYFADPSIAAASLGAGPDDLINDLRTFGLFFETMCIRDLRVYADSLGGSVYHYRDNTGLECDAVIHLRNGSYALIEIKLGGDELINSGSSNLQKLKNRIDTAKMKEPSFLMVLTAVGRYAYRRPDGVLVVPVGCLKN